MAATTDGQYEAPVLLVLGTVEDLTQTNPKFGSNLDGNNQNQLGKTSVWP